MELQFGGRVYLLVIANRLLKMQGAALFWNTGGEVRTPLHTTAQHGVVADPDTLVDRVRESRFGTWKGVGSAAAMAIASKPFPDLILQPSVRPEKIPSHLEVRNVPLSKGALRD